MRVISFIAICTLAAVLLYGREPKFLFWLALAIALFVLITGMSIFLLARKSAIERREITIALRQLEGASKRHIQELTAEPIMLEHDDFGDEVVPTWLSITNFLAVLVGGILFITGIIIRIIG